MTTAFGKFSLFVTSRWVRTATAMAVVFPVLGGPRTITLSPGDRDKDKDDDTFYICFPLREQKAGNFRQLFLRTEFTRFSSLYKP